MKKVYIVKEYSESFIGPEEESLGAFLSKEKAEAYMKALIEKQENEFKRIQERLKEMYGVDRCCEGVRYGIESIDLIDED
jgi:hypothetical protein